MESRLTFRDKCPTVCWQKQLRDHYASEGAPDVDLDLKKAIVRPVTRKLAEQIILKYEWLGTMPPVELSYGIFFGQHCAGVCCFGFSAGANLNAYKEFRLLDRHELAYLARGANVHWSPPGANSKLISFACRLLANATKARVALAYSDSDAGEIGTIYQASNWVCVGRGSSTRQWVAPTGRIYDQKLPYDLKRKQGGQRKRYVLALKNAGWKEQPSNPKYRYVYILDKSDKALVARIESMRQPYPKRQPCGGSDTVDTAGVHPAEGGPTPTPPLHISL
jgi:hypothetical protein